MSASRFSRFVRLALPLALAAVLVVASPAHAAPGDLDPTFGSGGTVTTTVGLSGEAYAVAIQGDGKIVAAGSSHNGSNNDFALARYTTSGALDFSFGFGGKVTTPIGSSEDLATAMAIQADGKIVVAGYSIIGPSVDFALARYTTTGALDTTFGTGGIVSTDFASGEDNAFAVAIQSDGKIVVAGYAHNGSNLDFALARYTSAGALDPGFGVGGKVTTGVGSGNDAATSVVIQADGKIAAAGASHNGSNNDFALARYTTAGALDPTFGVGGKVTTAVGPTTDQAHAVALQSDGKILAAGFSSNGSNFDFALARYTTAGSLDPSFGVGGKVTTGIGSSLDEAHAMALQGDGKIVLAGYSFIGSTFDFALARYTTSGALDSTFGNGGKVITAIGSGTDFAQAVAIQSDGKVVVAGRTIAVAASFALARYQTGLPTLSIADASVTEGDSGTTNMTFTVSVGVAGTQAPGDITVHYATAPDTATSSDYVAKSGDLTFGVGQTSKTITVSVKGDLIDEGEEAFFVHLSNPSGAIIENGTASGAITDNDPTPSISVSDPVVAEGNSGTTNAVFTLTLTNPSSDAIVVDYATANGTAVAGTDYQARSGTKLIRAGRTSAAISVPVNGDATEEASESFFLNLLDPDGATLGDAQGQATITDDDRPVISIADASVTEADGTTNRTMTFVVTLNHASTSSVTVHYTTVNGTAVAPGDYAAKSATLTFSAGQVSKNIAVTVKPDNLTEGAETFTVVLDTPTNASIGDGTAVGTINDDD